MIERERHLFDFQKALRGVGAEEAKYHSATKFKCRKGCWSRSEDISTEEPEFSVGDIVSIATYRRGALRRMRWALGTG